jgi:trehalose/maltose hydrolase-like predicted phosphorylase
VCAVGNGYPVSRAAALEFRADGVHHPGTYLVGCHDRTGSLVDGHQVEELLYCPNRLPLTFRPPGGEWFTSPRRAGTWSWTCARAC